MYIFVYTFVKLISTMKKHLLILATALLSISTFSQIPTYIPANGLVGWWPFNGNANDESGNGNHGTVNGATLTADRFGNANMAYSFDGVDDYLIMNASNHYVNTNLTISAYINPSTFQEVKFIEMGSQSSANWCLYTQNNLAIGFRKNAGCSNYNQNQFLTPVAPSIWKHVVLVTNANESKLYLDGVILQTLPSTPFDSSCPLSNLYIGLDILIQQEFWAGKIDDIGIWNRALTACEIQNLYQSQVNYVSQAISAGADQSICAGDNVTLSGAGGSNYQWNNNVVDGQAFTPNQSANYVLNGTDSLGCQGTDTVVVTVLENATSTLTQTALDSYTLNGQTYTQSGTYTQTVPAANGCDSTITLNLTLNFTGINELGTGAKKLVKITDLNGKVIPRRKNTLMLFIYEDGTVERVVEIEE